MYMYCKQDGLNNIIVPLPKKYTGAPTYTTTHRDKNVNGRSNQPCMYRIGTSNKISD